MLNQILKIIESYRFNFRNEAELQAGIEKALMAEGITFEREYKLGEYGRIDFYFPESGLGLEVKIDGSAASVLRQLQGYAKHRDIKSLLLVTNKPHLLAPCSLQSKPVSVLEIWNKRL